MKNKQSVILRGKIISAIREFFYAKKFHEVIVPVLNTALPLEQNIYPFQTIWNTTKGNKKYYLTTSPEANLKKMIAKGMGNCFAIGHSFRNLEMAGPMHHPEFLMLEWYREEANYEDIMKESESLITFIIKKNKEQITNNKSKTKIISLKKVWPRISMEILFRKYANLDLEELCHAEFIPHSAGRVRDDYNIKGANWEQIFNQIFLNEIEEHLPKEPFFLIDYPAKISPLCAKKVKKPFLAERFELYIKGIEIANGNTENTDAREVLKSMKNEEKYRKKAGILSAPIDMEFINSVKKMQSKNYAGIGLGIDRLAMILGGVDDIKQFNLSHSLG